MNPDLEKKKKKENSDFVENILALLVYRVCCTVYSSQNSLAIFLLFFLAPTMSGVLVVRPTRLD